MSIFHNENSLPSQSIEVEKENQGYTINLKMFMNRSTHSAWQVSDEFDRTHCSNGWNQINIFQDASVAKTFETFRALGLRHLVVVDKKNKVKGIITRKDFL